MSAIQRNITRAVFNATEVTKSTSLPGTDALPFVFQDSDALYLGFKERFTTRHIQMGVANTNAATLSVSYWDGSAWVAVTDLIDQTEGMTKSGFISWQNAQNQSWRDHVLTPVAIKQYWVRIQASATFSAGTTIQSILNLFCDSAMLRHYYPELVTDDRYFPVGRTDFMEQFLAAKNLVVDKLKADDLIRDESEVVDIDEVSIAAVHASAWVIYNPILRDGEGRDFLDGLWNSFKHALTGRKLDLDYDNSGVVEIDEENTGNFFRARV